MDKAFIQQMLHEADCQANLEKITLARELWQVIPADKIEDFCHVVLQHCMDHCRPLVPQANLTILLRAVTLFTGNAPSKPGIRAIRLQNNASAAPQRAVAGISTR